MREITIYDIALALDLSASTVSRALKDNKIINEATRLRVQQYALENGYRSNIFASNLRSGSTKTIGVIVPRLDSLFIAAFLAGAEKIAAQKGYQLIISQTFEQVEKEQAISRLMFDKRVDGLMISATLNTQNAHHLKPFVDAGIPVVFFDRVLSDFHCPGFTINNYEAGLKATQHLIDQGRKYLWHISSNSTCNIYLEREAGFLEACHNAGQKSQTLKFNHLNFEAGLQVAQRYLEETLKPDGMFFSNDITAASCLSELARHGVEIPNELALVGFNNDYYSKLVKPSLTTINYPANDLGTMVANYLVEHLKGNAPLSATQNVVLKSDLVIRESSVCKPN